MRNKHLENRGKSIYLLVLVFVVYALIYMTKNTYSAAMAAIVNEGIMTKSQTGLISAAFYLIYAPFQIVGGIAADKFSPSKLILIGILGAGICNLLVYFTQNYVMMIIIWSVNAIVQFGIWPAIFKIIVTELHYEHRTSGIFYINMSSTVGLLISYLLAVFITDWRNNFLISAIVLFALAIIFFILYSGIEKHMTVESVSDVATKINSKGKPKGNFGVIMKSGIPFLLFVNMVSTMINIGVKSFTPTMLMESYESVTPQTANALNIILVLAAPVGLLLSSLPLFRKKSATVCIAALILIELPLLLVASYVGKISIIIIISALTVLMVFASSISICFSYVARKFEPYGCVATVSGLVNCMASLGIVLANYVLTRIADASGWQSTVNFMIIITAIAFMLSAVSIPFWKKFTQKK